MNKSRVFIIEDDPDIVAAVELILSMESYQVHHAFTGKAALQKIQQVQPDLILLDYMLPDMNGDQLIKKLKQDTQSQHIPVVLVSAAHNINSIAKSLPIKAFMKKPFELDQLLTTVEKYSYSHN